MNRRNIILLHICFWIIYKSIGSYYYSMLFLNPNEDTFIQYLGDGINGTIGMIFFYINYLFLLNIDFNKKWYRSFAWAPFVIMAEAGSFCAFVQYYNNTFYAENNYTALASFKDGIMSGTTTYLMSCAFKFGETWFSNERQKIDLKKRKTENEYAFLRTQVNPDFLLNTLNDLFVTSKTNAANISDAILNLSDILRYTLYESSHDKISINNELRYLKKYINHIDLNLENVTIKYNENTKDDVMIEPMLLISFAVHVFKNLRRYSDNIETYIDINSTTDEISLKVSGTGKFDDELKSNLNDLTNTNIRLNLLYLNKHSIIQNVEDSSFSSSLKIYI